MFIRSRSRLIVSLMGLSWIGLVSCHAPDGSADEAPQFDVGDLVGRFVDTDDDGLPDDAGLPGDAGLPDDAGLPGDAGPGDFIDSDGDGLPDQRVDPADRER